MEERELMAQLYWEGMGVRDIAKVLGRDKGTVSRELERNASPKYECYTPCQAQKRATGRRAASSQGRYRLKDKRIRAYVEEKLAVGWSPELIAGRLKLDHPRKSISHEAIYQYIYHQATEGREVLIACLRRAHKKRKAKGLGRKEKKTKIPNRVSIEQRPVSADSRRLFGHWEGDSLVSRKSLPALRSLAERKSRYLLLTKVARKGAEETAQAAIDRLGALPKGFRRSITFDNGTEHARHERITKEIGIKCFFAHPYASWERGTNEHINGLIRWYLPKGTDFSKITDEEIAWIEWQINNRPRKCLGFKTPLEVAASSVALRG